MSSPIKPHNCVTTGRTLTEWFENEELTDDQIEERVLSSMGLDEAPKSNGLVRFRMPPEALEVWDEYQAKKAHYKRRKWKNGMTMTEVAHRLNEATKMVNPDNFKFLPDDVRARTGLEINPLWQMEVLYRSALLPPKEQVQLLSQLAAYTHSKAPSLSHNTNVNIAPEDWLLEISKDEYQTIDEAAPERVQPLQRREKGTSNRLEAKRLAKDTTRNDFILEAAAEAETLLTDLGDYYIGEGFNEYPDEE